MRCRDDGVLGTDLAFSGERFGDSTGEKDTRRRLATSGLASNKHVLELDFGTFTREGNQELTECPNKREEQPRITTACLLAAGTGSRLSPITDSIPKCLTEIDGRPILERLVTGLRQQGFKRLVVVVGYLEPQIREFLDGCAGDLAVEYVRNPIFRTTNNIYSLWLA